MLGFGDRLRGDAGLFGGRLDDAVVEQAEAEFFGDEASDVFPERTDLAGDGDNACLHGNLPD